MNPFINYHVGGAGILGILILTVWVIFWKIAALWVAAKNDSKKWFILLVILNTFGIVEIIFLFHVAKKNWNDIKEIFTSLKL